MSAVRGPWGSDVRRAEPLYVATWWERRFPWLLDVLVRLDPEPIAARLVPLVRPVGIATEMLCRPLSNGIDRLGRGLGRMTTAAGRVMGSVLRAAPLPGVVQDALWLRPRPLDDLVHDSATGLWRSQYSGVVRVSVLVAILAHVALFTFWPVMQVDDLTAASSELEAVELPPQIEIPPPPEQITRPAAPVMATVDIDDDITIAPTTFEQNPVTELPPPPTEEVVELRSRPTFTPFTVAPAILNMDEVRTLMITEYPPLLRASGVGGAILMWVYVDERGGIGELRIAEGSGYESLDAAAFRVAEAIRFSPALNRDENVPVWVQFPIVFTVR